MLEIIKAGGIVMIPLLLCSVIGSAIIIERLISLRSSKVIPKTLLKTVWGWVENGEVTEEKINNLIDSSYLGRLLAVGLINRKQPRFIIHQRLEDMGRQIVGELEYLLYILEIIFSIAPFLGLLGTVLGMIDIFNAVGEVERANSRELAGGIATALITTVTGLVIAIPTLAFHRYFLQKISRFTLEMESQAERLLDGLQLVNK